MKFIWTNILLFLNFIPFYCQTNSYIYKEDSYSRFIDIEESDQGNIIAGVNYNQILTFSDSSFFTKSKLLLINKRNIVINQLNLSFDEFQISQIFGLKKLSVKNRYLVSGFGSRLYRQFSKGYFFNLIIDENLNVFEKNIISLGEKVHYYTDVAFSNEVNSKVPIFFNQRDNNQRKDSRFDNSEVILDLNSLKFMDFKCNKNETSPLFNSYFCPYENKVKLIRLNIFDEKGYSYLSNNFSAITFNLKPSVFNINDTTYLIGSSLSAGRTFANPTDKLSGSGVKIVKIDSKTNFVEYFSTYNDLVPTQQIFGSISTISPDASNFYLANIDIRHINNSPKLEFIDIIKVGIDLREKWRVRFIVGDFKLLGHSIKSLNGDGIILCGSVIKNQNANGFLIRFDKDGRLIQAVGIDEKQLSLIKSYPNPTSGLFTIEGGSDMDVVKFFTMDGKELLRQSVEVENRAELDLTQFEAGIYLYSILDKSGKIISTGKVVKD